MWLRYDQSDKLECVEIGKKKELPVSHFVLFIFLNACIFKSNYYMPYRFKTY